MSVEVNLCCDSTDPNDPPTPFWRIIGLDWYDGVTVGVAQCRMCHKSFLAQLVAWDDRAVDRIFALTAGDSSLFDEVVALARQYDEPKWPSWVPSARMRSQSEHDQFADCSNRIVDRFAGDRWVVRARDLLEGIDAVTKLDSPDKTIALERMFVPNPVPPDVYLHSDETFAEWLKLLTA